MADQGRVSIGLGAALDGLRPRVVIIAAARNKMDLHRRAVQDGLLTIDQ